MKKIIMIATICIVVYIIAKITVGYLAAGGYVRFYRQREIAENSGNIINFKFKLEFEQCLMDSFKKYNYQQILDTLDRNIYLEKGHIYKPYYLLLTESEETAFLVIQSPFFSNCNNILKYHGNIPANNMPDLKFGLEEKYMESEWDIGLDPDQEGMLHLPDSIYIQANRINPLVENVFWGSFKIIPEQAIYFAPQTYHEFYFWLPPLAKTIALSLIINTFINL